MGQNAPPPHETTPRQLSRNISFTAAWFYVTAAWRLQGWNLRTWWSWRPNVGVTLATCTLDVGSKTSLRPGRGLPRASPEFSRISHFFRDFFFSKNFVHWGDVVWRVNHGKKIGGICTTKSPMVGWFHHRIMDLSWEKTSQKMGFLGNFHWGMQPGWNLHVPVPNDLKHGKRCKFLPPNCKGITWALGQTEMAWWAVYVLVRIVKENH